MGMFDDVMVLPSGGVDATCAAGHRMDRFQTKGLACDMSTYLIHERRLYHVDQKRGRRPVSEWTVLDDHAKEVFMYPLSKVVDLAPIRLYSSCDMCEPILVRNDCGTMLGDMIAEHRVYVDFMLAPDDLPNICLTRVSGARQDIKQDLMRRGLNVLSDDDPIAVAHRQLKAARTQMEHLSGGAEGW